MYMIIRIVMILSFSVIVHFLVACDDFNGGDRR